MPKADAAYLTRWCMPARVRPRARGGPIRRQVILFRKSVYADCGGLVAGGFIGLIASLYWMGLALCLVDVRLIVRESAARRRRRTADACCGGMSALTVTVLDVDCRRSVPAGLGGPLCLLYRVALVQRPKRSSLLISGELRCPCACWCIAEASNWNRSHGRTTGIPASGSSRWTLAWFSV